MTYRQITSEYFDEMQLSELFGYVSFETWQVSALQDIARMVEEDMGFALLPKALVAERENFGTLKVFEPTFRPAKNPIYTPLEACYLPRSEFGPAQAYFLSLLVFSQT
ncbi:hypothetical protein ACVFI8_19075 [Agarivorans sp. MS3-6]|uniref:hypothetical protein n=1 Tax=Agarivorans sp. TSD2052 TaxID=2937286 RepID=UPI002010AA8C|nr:hypothetical protein [Agarivorans sp. TSD2052]UPW17059.1 hypothetical protein M0C34_12455 [Agarivorans sp. TSD2052]